MENQNIDTESLNIQTFDITNVYFDKFIDDFDFLNEKHIKKFKNPLITCPILINHPSLDFFAKNMIKKYKLFKLPVKWDKFSDTTPNLKFLPILKNSHVIFLLNCLDMTILIDQLILLSSILDENIQKCDIIIPYYAVGTMERSDSKGVVATANNLSKIISGFIKEKVNIIFFDIHSIVQKYYFSQNIKIEYLTGVKLLDNVFNYSKYDKKDKIQIDCICFPDEGAKKRFLPLFKNKNIPIITCDKIRKDDERKININSDSNFYSSKFKSILIVDDLMRTGGTLFECGKILKEKYDCDIYIYTTHAIISQKTLNNLPETIFKKIFITNTIENIIELPSHFQILDICDVLDIMLEKNKPKTIKKYITDTDNYTKLYSFWLFLFTKNKPFELYFCKTNKNKDQIYGKNKIQNILLERKMNLRNHLAFYDIKEKYIIIITQNGIDIDKDYIKDICGALKLTENLEEYYSYNSIDINKELYEEYLKEKKSEETLGEFLKTKYNCDDDWYYLIDSKPRWYQIYKCLRCQFGEKVEIDIGKKFCRKFWY